jgi:hypothetical protein
VGVGSRPSGLRIRLGTLPRASRHPLRPGRSQGGVGPTARASRLRPSRLPRGSRTYTGTRERAASPMRAMSYGDHHTAIHRPRLGPTRDLARPPCVRARLPNPPNQRSSSMAVTAMRDLKMDRDGSSGPRRAAVLGIGAESTGRRRGGRGRGRGRQPLVWAASRNERSLVGREVALWSPTRSQRPVGSTCSTNFPPATGGPHRLTGCSLSPTPSSPWACPTWTETTREHRERDRRMLVHR